MVLAILLLGFFLGTLGGFLGTGGGTFAIPALVVFLGYDQKLAQGTALVMVVANVAKGLLKYRDRNGLDLRIAAALAASGSLSAGLCASWAMLLPSELLKLLYGGFLIFLAAFMLAVKNRRRTLHVLDWRWATLPGLAGGVSLGLFGVGGAMLAVPLLVLFFGQTQVRAQGLGLALALPGCAISFLEYAAHGHVDWITGGLLAAAGLAGVGYGVHFAHAISERLLTALFCLFLVVAGIVLILR